jgi:hypothetical protein
MRDGDAAATAPEPAVLLGPDRRQGTASCRAVRRSQARRGDQVTTLSVIVSQPRCCKGSALQGSRQTRLVAQSLISHCSMTRNHLSPDSPCRSDGGIPFHVRFYLCFFGCNDAPCSLYRRRLYKYLFWAIFGNWRNALIALAVSPGPLSPLSLPGLTSSLQPTAIFCAPYHVLLCISLGYVVNNGKGEFVPTSHNRYVEHSNHIDSLALTDMYSPATYGPCTSCFHGSLLTS